MYENVESQDLSADRPLSESIVRAIARAEDITPEEVSSRVYDVVDPDALDRLFDTPGVPTQRHHTQLSFRLDGYEVIVQGGELVMVRRPEMDLGMQE